MPVHYEWTLETIEDGDIVDSDFADTLTFSKEDLTGNDLGLVRYEGTEAAGVQFQLWAYVKDGKLPEYFSDANGATVGYKVPSKYHTELINYLK